MGVKLFRIRLHETNLNLKQYGDWLTNQLCVPIMHPDSSRFTDLRYLPRNDLEF